MARTTTITRTATLEDVTRRCSLGIAARAAMLEEGIGHARQARGHVSDAEQQMLSAMASLAAIKPIFSGTTEYMLTSGRLIAEMQGALEIDLQEIRSIQSNILALEEPTAEILQQLLAYSVETIQSRIRIRMNKLGGDFAMPSMARPTVNLGQGTGVTRRRPESIPPPRDIALSEINEGMAMDGLVQAGLENFERGGALLESCFDAMELVKVTCGQATRSLEAVHRKYQELEELEASSNSTEIGNAMGQLRQLLQDVELQGIRLERIGQVPERARGSFLAIFENMGRLLVSGVVSEGSPAEAREVSAREVLQRALEGDVEAIRDFALVSDEPQHQAMSDALYHAARNEDLETALRAVEALRTLALAAGDIRAEAGDNLLSLSNSPSVPEALRSAATAALIDLTDDGTGTSP